MDNVVDFDPSVFFQTDPPESITNDNVNYNVQNYNSSLIQQDRNPTSVAHLSYQQNSSVPLPQGTSIDYTFTKIALFSYVRTSTHLPIQHSPTNEPITLSETSNHR